VLLLPTATEKRAFLFSGFEAVDYKRIEKNSLVLLFIISLLPVGINEQHIFLHLNYLFILVKDRLICFCYFFFGGWTIAELHCQAFRWLLLFLCLINPLE